MTIQDLLNKLVVFKPETQITFDIWDDESRQFYPQDSAEIIIREDKPVLRIYDTDDSRSTKEILRQ